MFADKLALRPSRSGQHRLGQSTAALFASLGLIAAATSAPARDAAGVRWPDAYGRVELRGDALGSEIVIGTSTRMAGAIDSLVWADREFINSLDHGRELQSASSFNKLGECFNPTEAGSARDSDGPESSSVLLSLRAEGRELRTRSQMAFWLEEGETSIQCSIGTSVPRSRTPHTLSKAVTIGALGIANAIEHRVTFTVPDAYDTGTFEALTAYTTPDLTRFHTYDPRSGELAALSNGPGEQPLPVIFSTPDGAYALGVYSRELPQPKHPEAGFGRFNFSTLPGGGNATMKWNCVFRMEPVQAGDHSFTCFTLVGSLRDVQDGMSQLHAALDSGVPPDRDPDRHARESDQGPRRRGFEPRGERPEADESRPADLRRSELDERRLGFDEREYLRCHPDVRQAVERGSMESGALHYRLFGRREGRRLNC
jgi:hypothetical protein